MKKIHFIAIGGAIMHQLAMALQRQGFVVTGSDDEINDPAKSNLKNAGLLPEKEGWYPEKITKDLDGIVLGMHAKKDNPELLAAQALQIPVYSFPEYVYKVSEHKKRIVIAGSHGKTTITSMIMHVLKDAGLEFDYLVGAKVDGFSESVKLSDAPVIILEGDEYPASAIEKKPKIFFYHPHISVLSGIAWDHINVFPTYENYKSQFEYYLAHFEKGTVLIYNNEDSEVHTIVATSAVHCRNIPYSYPVYHYKDGQAFVEVERKHIGMSVFGKHNLLNMQAACAVCMQLGISEMQFYTSIAGFSGAARRLEKLFERDNIIAYRDFAHAPSKLAATLNAVREAYPTHKLIACFELHTYSSLNEAFLSEYKGSMNAPDISIVFYSKHALELKGLPDLDKQVIQTHFNRSDLGVFNNKEDLFSFVKKAVAKTREKVCLLLMSSGTFEGLNFTEL